MNKRYYSLVTVGETATLNIYGDITSWPWNESDVSSYNLSKQLDEMQGVTKLDVYINSYGGEVAEGLAIYNALRRKAQTAHVTTYCDGFACSIASVIYMAGTERKMSKASLLMIHNAWTWGEGNAAELRKLADDMDIITSASVEAYKEVASISEKKIRALMDAESWITPKDAVKYGFATEILDEKTENPSQNVRKTLMGIVIAAETAKNGEKAETEDNPEDEDENAENDVVNEENDDTNDEEEQQDDADTSKQEETEDDDPSEDDPEDDEKSEEKQEKPAEKLGGFFNYFQV